MFKRVAYAGLAILLFTLISAAPASAASQIATTPRSPAAPQAVSLIHKVTLWGETSIDGPALSSTSSNFEGVHSNNTTIAWIGIDSLHHLNLMQSSDNPALGALTFGHKLTLHETSIVRPAVVYMGGGLGVTAVAWVGTDPSHTLNVMWDAYFSKTKLTLWGESSNFAPALVRFGSNLILAWTGTDTNHSLNVLPISMSDFKAGAKTILPRFSSSAGPNLSVYPYGTGEQLVLNWTTPTQHLNLATSTDGVHFTNALGSAGTLQLSAQAPSSLYIPAEGGPDNWMAWTGTDLAHHLNIQWTQHFPQWPNAATTKTVLADSALGGPQIASNEGLVIAWTGTDPAHTLNVAEFQGF